MRRLALAATVLTVSFPLAACGDGEEGTPLGYLPADASVTAVVSTDLESDAWQALEDRLLAGPLSPQSVEGFGLPVPPPTSLEGYLRQLAAFSGLDYDEDVEPLLGGELVVGYTDAAALIEGEEDSGAAFVAALDTGEEETLRGVLERLELSEREEFEGAAIYTDESGFTQLAVDGGVLLYAQGASDFADDQPAIPSPALADAIELERGGEGLAEDDLAEDGLDAEALVRIHAQPELLLESPELSGLAELPWFAALESAGASLSFDDQGAVAEAVLRTDPEGLTEEDLPLPSGVETPELVRSEGEVAGASANQSQTTVFLYEAVRAAFPDSRFVRDVARLERERGLDFEADFLRQFDGPSASSVPLDGEFAARSEVADPERMARTLRAIVPDVGRLVQDLQGLQGRGLIPLFLIAPDAPIAPGVLGGSRIDVSPVAGEPDLYLIRGLIPPGLEPVTPLPREIVFGLLDGVFVVASDLERAQAIASAQAEPPPEGVEGASVAAGDLEPLRDELEELLDFDPGPLGELRAFATASTEELRAGASVDLP